MNLDSLNEELRIARALRDSMFAEREAIETAQSNPAARTIGFLLPSARWMHPRFEYLDNLTVCQFTSCKRFPDR